MAQSTGFPNGYSLEAAAGLFAVIGHVFPVWLGFRGGKGVATAAGVFAAMMPLTTLVCLGIFLVVFLMTRYVSLASIIGAVSLAVLCIVFDSRRQPLVDFVYIAMPMLVIAKHNGNISRLLSHTEPKFGTKTAG
jgi:glycerol-3-phosphate acyltransferase PlsY